MSKILIVADDFTGANDTAVLAPMIGLSAYTVFICMQSFVISICACNKQTFQQLLFK